MAERGANGSPLENMRMAVAARRYYLDGATKSAISDELGVSRFKVARLLDEAVRAGVVTIEVKPPSDVHVDLSLELAGRFDLRQALVVRPSDDRPEFRRQQLGRAAASALADLVEDGDVLGVAWGRTLHEMVQALPPLPRSTVVQIVGSVPSADLRVNSLDLVRTIAERANGRVHVLHVPMIVDSADTAQRLRHDGHVAATVGMFDKLTKALVGIGAWREAESSLMLAMPPDLRATMTAAGGVADLCATILDSDGHEVTHGDLRGRSIAITTEQLRQVPDVIAVAGGPHRAQAIRAVLRSGLVHRLITDDKTATALIDVDDSTGSLAPMRRG